MIFNTLLPAQEAEEGLSIIRYEAIGSKLKVNNIIVDEQNSIWFASSNGVHKITHSDNEPQSFLAGKAYIDVAIGRKGKVWAADERSVFSVKSEEKFEVPLGEATINDIEYYKGKLWIATTNGLFTFNPVAEKFLSYTTSNSKLRSNHINLVSYGSNDVLYVGTDDGSVEIKGDKWRNEFKREKVMITRENNEGQWFVTDEDMYIISIFNRLISVGLDDKLHNGRINDFVIDSKGRIYFASDILVRYNPYNEKIESYAEDVALLSKKCISLACDKNDNIWIGTEDGGLFRIVFADIAAEQLSAACIIQNSISCYGSNDASIRVNVSGGTKPYKYKWSDNRMRGKNPRNVKPGSYSLTVTDKNGVPYFTSVDIEEPSKVEINVLETTRITAPRKKDGTASIEVKGGEGPYNIKWSHGATDMSVEKLAAGKYRITATDANGCEAVASTEIKREKFIPELDITKVNVGQTLRINDLYFDADSSAITPDNFEIMNEVFDFLDSHKSVVIEIGGHTNTIPPHEYCDRLSTARAQSVAQYLYNKGIESKRISYKGYGKRNPITSDSSLAGRQKNQRVEIKILSIE